MSRFSVIRFRHFCVPRFLAAELNPTHPPHLRRRRRPRTLGIHLARECSCPASVRHYRPVKAMQKSPNQKTTTRVCFCGGRHAMKVIRISSENPADCSGFPQIWQHPRIVCKLKQNKQKPQLFAIPVGRRCSRQPRNPRRSQSRRSRALLRQR